MIAALYVQTGGSYYGLDGVDPWDEKRDARLYPGPHPVVAHPPCSRWCQLAHVNQRRYGHKVGDDGGCFAAALESVRSCGGVLEHPAYTYAWERFGIARPSRWCWTRDMMSDCAGGMRAWVTEVSQSAYGHAARKRTWLYLVTAGEPPDLDWRDDPGTHWCGNADGSGYPPGHPKRKPTLGKAAALKTPVAFRDALINMARNAR